MLIKNNWEKGETKAEGVSFEVKPLSVGLAMSLEGVLTDIKNKNNQEYVLEVFEIAKPIIESGPYVRNIKGIQIEVDGKTKDAEPSDLLDYPHFATLLVEILWSLHKASNLGENDLKNYKRPPQKNGSQEGSKKKKAAK